MDLAERMVRYRAARSMNQKKLAELCGVSLQTINNVERNRQAPTAMTRAKIEMVLEKEE